MTRELTDLSGLRESNGRPTTQKMINETMNRSGSGRAARMGWGDSGGFTEFICFHGGALGEMIFHLMEFCCSKGRDLRERSLTRLQALTPYCTYHNLDHLSSVPCIDSKPATSEDNPIDHYEPRSSTTDCVGLFAFKNDETRTFPSRFG